MITTPDCSAVPAPASSLEDAQLIYHRTFILSTPFLPHYLPRFYPLAPAALSGTLLFISYLLRAPEQKKSPAPDRLSQASN